MKFYVASRLENAETVKRVAAVLKAAGHTHTYDWTEHGSVQKEGQERLAQVAELEKMGVAEANILVVILPGGRGTHAELGIALGSDVKQIIICAETDDAFKADESTCAFYWNRKVKRVVGQMDDWLAEILECARKIDSPYSA